MDFDKGWIRVQRCLLFFGQSFNSSPLLIVGVIGSIISIFFAVTVDFVHNLPKILSAGVFIWIPYLVAKIIGWIVPERYKKPK